MKKINELIMEEGKDKSIDESGGKLARIIQVFDTPQAKLTIIYTKLCLITSKRFPSNPLMEC